MRYPISRIAADTYEINEFDCASMFLIVGRERALLIEIACVDGVELRFHSELIHGRGAED